MKVQTNNTSNNRTSAYYIWKALIDLGHDALLASEYSEDADLVLNIDGEDPVQLLLGKPSIYWDCDSFFHSPNDLAFTSQHVFIGGSPEDLARYPKGTIYLPHACDPDIHKNMNEAQDFDIVFVGNHLPIYKKRMDMVNLLKDKYTVLDSETNFGTPYATEMSKGKLIFNMSLGDKNIPMRFFEGMAIGVLLENYNDNLDSLATSHKHYIPYKSYEDLLKQVDYYLSHDADRKAIAQNARKHVLKHHTYKNRVQTMLSYL